MSVITMPFKKLHATIKELLENLEISEPTRFQTKSIPVIKSGANVFCTGPAESGKTTTLILTTMHKLKCEAVGTAPRAIILVENREKALAIHDTFAAYTRYSSLRVYLADEKIHIDLLKSEIFEGVDILIATPQSLNKLLLSNGVSTSSLMLFSIDDADFLSQRAAFSTLLSITPSITKCQFVLYAQKMTPKLHSLDSYFMEYAKIVSV